jgi:adenosylcobinamide kinase / adenosylcobinamide-phosphate guanylyltransferase
MYTFVTGGVRSGRSNYALRRAAELGHPPWLYVSTGTEADDAVRKRLDRYRKDAEAIWRTAVMPAQLTDLMQPSAVLGFGALVFDGLLGWIQARLGEHGPNGERAVLEEVERFGDRVYRSAVPVVVVSGEIGFGFSPQTPEELRFLRVATSANQILAENAGAVVLMVSGVPLRVR